MPRYEVRCQTCGDSEVLAPIALAVAGKLTCAVCHGPAGQVFDAEFLANGRVSAGGEDSPIAARIADGTHIFNAGLPGVERIVGTRRNGKPALEYRPITNNELGSNHAAREYGKRHNLEPGDKSGRYRPLGKR